MKIQIIKNFKNAFREMSTQAVNLFKKKFIFFASFLFFIHFFSFAQKNIQVHPTFNIGSNITLNLQSKEHSAISPINFFAGGGADIKINNLSIIPTHNIWAMYYLYYDDKALPAEVEHRTASVINCMLDLPVGYNFYKNNSVFTVGAGLGILFRISFLSSGVSESDTGYSGNAKSDLENINKYFYSNARFLYPEIFFSYLYNFSNDFSAGAMLKYYVSIGNLAAGSLFDASIISVSTRIMF